jgi:purine-binding chemotaxis protein CheW
VAAPTLLFRVGDGVYGCDIGDAREIIPLRPMTRLPGAPPFVRGLINMRGTIVTVLDLGARLDPAHGPTLDGSILLVRHRERLVGLVVDSVADVRVLDGEVGSAGAGPGSAMAGAAGSIVRGVATADGVPVVVLDLDTLIKQVLLS